MSEQQVNPEEPLENSPTESATQDAATADAEQAQQPGDDLHDKEVSYRRAPKIWPFLILGLLVGVIIALIIAVTGEPSPDYTVGGTFGYFAVIFGVVGVGLGGIFFLILDRRSLKQAHAISVKPIARSAEDVKE